MLSVVRSQLQIPMKILLPQLSPIALRRARRVVVVNFT
jgi:hypothetical protein